jgi:hypothetical protein
MNKEFQVKLTTRGFATEAMSAIGGDVVRGLIELITNADDAYQRHSGAIVIAKDGTSVHTDYAESISVFDTARGMSATELNEKMTNLGGENLEFLEGHDVRGNLGRGAKDCSAFGAVLFRTIQNGEYSELIIRSTGKGSESGGRPAENADYQNLRIPQGGNGLVASMLFVEALRRRIPSNSKMIERLSNEAQLRDINRSRECYFEDGRGGRVRLLSVEVEVRRELTSTTLSVNGFEAFVVIEELAHRVEEGFGPCAPNGLLLCGSKAIYENTFFDLQGHPEARWVRGRISCPGIDQIIRDYDRNGPIDGVNDSRLIDRDRSGLSKTHPFRIALAGQVAPLIAESFRRIREDRGQQQVEGEELRRKLRVLSRAVQGEMNALLEDEERGVGSEGEGSFRIIPGGLRVLIGSNFSVSVVSPITNEDGVLKVTHDSELALVDEVFTWRPRGSSGASIQTLRFRALTAGVFQIRIALRDELQQVSVHVLEETDPEEEIDYSPLRFVKSVVSCRPGRSKSLDILAPIGIDVLTIRVLNGEATVPVDVTLDPSSDGRGMRGGFRVTIPNHVQQVKVSAKPVGSSEEITATINVQESEGRGLPEFKFEVKNIEEGQARSTMVPGEPKIVIAYGKHAANQQSLGEYDEENLRFTRESEPEAVRMLAELFAYELAKFVVEHKAQQEPDAFSDAAQVMAKHAEYSQRLVSLAIAALASSLR